MSKSDKKSKFTEQQKSKTGIYFLSGILVVAIVVAGAFIFFRSKANAGLSNVGAVDYTGQTAQFEKIQPKESGGDIVLDLNEIKSRKTTTFDVQGVNFDLNGRPMSYLPLLAYVSPSGNVMVATSICEPCSGLTFHVEGDQLVCNACGTRWSLEDLQGISGGCPQYPPEKMKYTVDGDKLVIKKADLENWKPRVIQ